MEKKIKISIQGSYGKREKIKSQLRNLGMEIPKMIHDNKKGGRENLENLATLNLSLDDEVASINSYRKHITNFTKLKS